FRNVSQHLGNANSTSLELRYVSIGVFAKLPVASQCFRRLRLAELQAERGVLVEGVGPKPGGMQFCLVPNFALRLDGLLIDRPSLFQAAAGDKRSGKVLSILGGRSQLVSLLEFLERLLPLAFGKKNFALKPVSHLVRNRWIVAWVPRLENPSCVRHITCLGQH